MPAEEDSDAPLFTERLSVPWQWWVIGAVGVAVGGAEVFAGFNWHIAVLVYLALGLPVLVLLVGMGRARIRVDAAGLHAGGRTLAPSEVAAVRTLDARLTRARLGPAADPRAYLVTRGFIKTAVEVTTAGNGAPYWLLSTRHPQELARALQPSA